MNTQQQAKWYVYTLVDPRDGQIFYVGKGSGSRVHQHEKDAAKPETVCSKKINKIKDIWKHGCEVGKEFCAYFWDEQAAYDHETDLIEEIGLTSLTNVLPGGQKAWERRRLERESRRAVKPLYAMLAEKGGDMKALYARFAEWFRAGLHRGTHQVRITCSDPRFKVNAMVSEVVYNTMLPEMWRQICADQRCHEPFRSGMLVHGIEVV